MNFLEIADRILAFATYWYFMYLLNKFLFKKAGKAVLRLLVVCEILIAVVLLASF